MDEQMSLIDANESYSLIGLKDACYKFVKKKYPSPMECEEYEDYLQMLSDEADLEFASRLRVIADEIEKRVLEPLKKNIHETYKGVEIKK